MATLKQVAERAGLSMATVSHVLGRRADAFRPETRAKVQAAARELGYRPNSSAQAMRTGRFNCAAIVSSAEPGLGTAISQGKLPFGVHEALTAAGMQMLFAAVSDEEFTSEAHVPQILSKWMVDGLLVNFNLIPEPMIELIHKYDVPSIWINADQSSDAVHPDDFGAGREATEHLLKLGHHRIAYVDYSHNQGDRNDHYSTFSRQRGYEQAMRAAGLTPRVIRNAKGRNLPRDQRIGYSRRWLSEPDRPAAVVAYGSATAWPVMVAAERDLRLRIPTDLSVITFDEALVDATGTPIATMIVPAYEMGRVAVAMLQQKIEAPGQALPTQVVPFSFRQGATCASPSLE